MPCPASACLYAWAAGHTFVWVDKEITDLDRQWVSAHHPSEAPLHRVDPRFGLTDADFSTLRQWLAVDGGNVTPM